MLLVLMAAALVAVLAYRPKHSSSAPPSLGSPPAHPAGIGVAIKPGADACEAAERLRGQKLLVATAPHLPLNGCTSEQCTCVFRRFDDRRRD